MNSPTLLEQAELALDSAGLTERVTLDEGSFDGKTPSVQISLPAAPDGDLAKEVQDALHLRHLHLAGYGFMLEGTVLEQLARGDVLAVVQAAGD